MFDIDTLARKSRLHDLQAKMIIAGKTKAKSRPVILRKDVSILINKLRHI
jgi:hypothetical protein